MCSSCCLFWGKWLPYARETLVVIVKRGTIIVFSRLDGKTAMRNLLSARLCAKILLACTAGLWPSKG